MIRQFHVVLQNHSRGGSRSSQEARDGATDGGVQSVIRGYSCGLALCPTRLCLHVWASSTHC